MAAVIKNGPPISDADLERVGRDNPGWKIERADDGSVLVSRTSTPGGAQSGEAFAQLHTFARHAGGKAYDSSTGFKNPRGGVVSPDAAWIDPEHLARFAHDAGYWQTMPTVAIEVASPTDSWPQLTAKVDQYVQDGATYAIAIDPQRRTTYARGVAPQGLALDIDAIIDA